MPERHFSFTEFVAYKLGTRSGMVEKLEQHLQAECTDCLHELAFIGRLMETTDTGRSKAQAEAPAWPENVVHPMQHPVRAFASGLIRMARLIFDSGLHPFPAGVRSGKVRPDRHIVYAERELMLDMRVEPESSDDSQSIIGQVQSKTVEEKQLSGLPVLLMQDERVVMGTHTNVRGEFVFNRAPRGTVTVCLVCADRQVRVPCPIPLS